MSNGMNKTLKNVCLWFILFHFPFRCQLHIDASLCLCKLHSKGAGLRGVTFWALLLSLNRWPFNLQEFLLEIRDGKAVHPTSNWEDLFKQSAAVKQKQCFALGHSGHAMGLKGFKGGRAEGWLQKPWKALLSNPGTQNKRTTLQLVSGIQLELWENFLA